MGLPLWAPVLYIGFLFGPLYIFSKYYMGKKQLRSSEDIAFFPQNHSRDLYVSLLSHSPTPSDTILISALINRAMEAISRLLSIKNNKNSLQVLMGKGLVGDEFWLMFLEAEKELEAEIREVVEEANSYKNGWGQFVLAHANDMVQHEKHKKVYENIEVAKADYYAKHPNVVRPNESLLQPTAPAQTHIRSPQAQRTQISSSTSSTPGSKAQVKSSDSTPAQSNDEKENVEGSPNKSVKSKPKKAKKRK